MNILQPLKIFIVSLALVAPGLVFVFTGPVPGFEQKEQTVFPNTTSVLLPAPESRSQLADAIFERSAAKRFAIQSMNALHLYGFGFIETAGVISGSDGWLFYKPQFFAWACNRHDDLQMKLDRFIFLNELVVAAEIPLVFALAPNKASIEREYLGGRSSRYLDCYLKFEQKLTSAVSGLDHRYFVDHSQVLRHPPEEQPAYLQFDTHWTQESALLAMNQLFESRPGILGIPLYQAETRKEQASMDILNLMLLLEREELVTVPVSVKPGPEEIKTAQLASNALFIHDSFYGRILEYISDRSPNTRFQLPLPGKDVPVRENLESADIVVVEMIQRDFLDFLWSDSFFGWGSIFAEWLLDEMAVAARQCNWGVGRDLLADQGTTIRNLRMKGSKRTRVLFQVPDDVASGRVCVRLQVEASGAGGVKMYFSAPGGSRNQPGYSGSLMVSKNIQTGSNTLALVLPEDFRGKWVRLDSMDHNGGFKIQKLEITSFD